MKAWGLLTGSILIGAFSNIARAQDFYGYSLSDSLTLTEISLRREQLNEFPEDLLHFKNLESLDLRNNKLDSIPNSISKLSKLKKILLSRNTFNHFPEALKTLQQLEHVDLWDNSITDLNFGLETFPNLKYIDISGILLQPDIHDALTTRFKTIEFNSSPPCDCMYLKKKE